ncbi:MAG: thiamine diphosphokinase [Anaerolineae bacterium]
MRVVIFANGVIQDLDDVSSRWIRSGDILAAADGGTRYALEAGLMPDYVIGDLDSLSDELRTRLTSAGTEFHTSPAAKDETDLELALMWAAETPGVTEIVILGAFGGRPDQELANMLLLALPDLVAHHVLMVDGAWTVQLIRPGVHTVLQGSPGDRLSLIPLGGTARGIRTTGLAFPLEGEALAFSKGRGVSNRFEAELATVDVQEGLLWCFHEHNPDAPSPGV